MTLATLRRQPTTRRLQGGRRGLATENSRIRDPSSRARAAVRREPVRVDDCRHVCATTWLRAGVPLGEVARRPGHSVETLVGTYVGALDGDDTAAKQLIDSAPGPSRAWSAESALRSLRLLPRTTTRPGEQGSTTVKKRKAVTWVSSLVTACQVQRPRQDSNLRTRLRRVLRVWCSSPGGRSYRHRDRATFPRSSRGVGYRRR